MTAPSDLPLLVTHGVAIFWATFVPASVVLGLVLARVAAARRARSLGASWTGPLAPSGEPVVLAGVVDGASLVRDGERIQLSGAGPFKDGARVLVRGVLGTAPSEEAGDYRTSRSRYTFEVATHLGPISARSAFRHVLAAVVFLLGASWVVGESAGKSAWTIANSYQTADIDRARAAMRWGSIGAATPFHRTWNLDAIGAALGATKVSDPEGDRAFIEASALYERWRTGTCQKILSWLDSQRHHPTTAATAEACGDPASLRLAARASMLVGRFDHASDLVARDASESDEHILLAHRAHLLAGRLGDGMKVLEMPYGNTDLAMDVILQDSATGLPVIESKLASGTFATWTSSFRPHRVDVTFPKLKFTWGGSMKKPLEKLGMASGFDPRRADFGGIASAAGNDLYVSDVIHKAFVAIDEAGTEAAAATGMIMALPSGVPMEPPATFTADHPFVFVIRDTKQGRILFMGRVTNPTA